MKLRNIILFIFFSLFLLGSQCNKDMDCRTILVNNTSETLWYNFDCIDHPDSAIWVGNCLESKVSAYSSKEVCTNETWETRFSTFKSSKVRIYIISADTAKKYSMPAIVKGIKYYRRDFYSLEELKELDWKITYP